MCFVTPLQCIFIFSGRSSLTTTAFKLDPTFSDLMNPCDLLSAWELPKRRIVGWWERVVCWGDFTWRQLDESSRIALQNIPNNVIWVPPMKRKGFVPENSLHLYLGTLGFWLRCCSVAFCSWELKLESKTPGHSTSFCLRHKQVPTNCKINTNTHREISRTSEICPNVYFLVSGYLSLHAITQTPEQTNNLIFSEVCHLMFINFLATEKHEWIALTQEKNVLHVKQMGNPFIYIQHQNIKFIKFLLLLTQTRGPWNWNLVTNIMHCHITFHT